MQIFTNANHNFIRWRWHALALSAAVIIGGIAVLAMRGLPLGIDFSGGTMLVVEFDQAVTLDQVRGAVGSLPGDEVVQQFDDPAKRQVMIRLPQIEGQEQGASLEEGSRQAEQALKAAGLPN